MMQGQYGVVLRVVQGGTQGGTKRYGRIAPSPLPQGKQWYYYYPQAVQTAVSGVVVSPWKTAVYLP